LNGGEHGGGEDRSRLRSHGAVVHVSLDGARIVDDTMRPGRGSPPKTGADPPSSSPPHRVPDVNDPQPTWTEISRSPSDRRAREHALVLQAMGVRSIRAQDAEDHILLVPTERAEFARDQLEHYDRENKGWPPREDEPVAISEGVHAAIVYAGLMVLVFLADQRDSFGVDWAKAGIARADAIRSGEWWRALTALTLHADALHLAGNVVFGALLGVVLAQSIGVGLAWLGFVATGALGNLANAFVQAPRHASLGASTAVFGVLGIQVAYEWMRRRELGYRGWRRWAPLIMGAVWLGWFGTGGVDHDPTKSVKEAMRDIDVALQGTDVMAHVLGFAAGIALGALLGLRKRRIALEPWLQAALALAAPAILALAWAAALHA
jgi:membrane associated rhomboid family serine protease